MTTEDNLQYQIQENQRRCRKWLIHAMVLTGVVLLLALSSSYFQDRIVSLGGYAVEYRHIAWAFMMPLCIFCIAKWIGYAKAKREFSQYGNVVVDLERALCSEDVVLVRQTISTAQAVASRNALAHSALNLRNASLANHLENLVKADLRKKLKIEVTEFEAQCDRKLARIKSQVPLVKAEAQIRASLALIQCRRDEISRQWEMAYEKFSWWNKLKYAGTTPDFSEMDKVARNLTQMHESLLDKHRGDLKRLDAHFMALKAKAFARISAAKAASEQFIAECRGGTCDDADLLKKAVWFSALSLPVSVWSDLDRAGNVYDALRRVNDNFSGMSDGDIWWETLFMPAQSLAGLAALTKGAYFEQLVADDSGGVLFEHFNNPDTDIVIDGMAYQLKATGSATYVNSVDDDFPVIATTEVASVTGAIDAGYSNEELTSAVDLALGGTVVDIGDSAVDAILSGLGGLGLFATIAGINHASEKYNNGGDAVEALFAGAGVAIEGTARALVNAAEMGYNVLTSRPSRFVGRVLLKGLVKIDEKLTGDVGRR